MKAGKNELISEVSTETWAPRSLSVSPLPFHEWCASSSPSLRVRGSGVLDKLMGCYKDQMRLEMRKHLRLKVLHQCTRLLLISH